MRKKKAKLVFKHNSFDIIEEGDYVLCAVSGKEIMLKNLNYWNVELQEAYYSPIEVNLKFKNGGKAEIIMIGRKIVSKGVHKHHKH